MKKLFIQKVLLFFILLLSAGFVAAQPFHDEIESFKKQDSINFPPKHAILFLGSSSFRKWTDVQEAFPNYKIINRGFGGSTFPDAIRYLDEIVYPYQPRQIFIYEGDNDVASSPKITGDSVFNRFKKLYFLLRKNLPSTTIDFVSIKPSPSRENLMPAMEEANSLIKNFLKNKKKGAFIDVYHSMLNDKGLPDKSIFGPDMLHMNAKGYAIWQKIIQPYLIKNKM
ncbi:MAG: GDSL-type esterase/lipase family protein [Ginsengibacter sp.]